MLKQNADLKRLLQENAAIADQKRQEQDYAHAEAEAAAVQRGREEMKQQAEEAYKAKKQRHNDKNA